MTKKIDLWMPLLVDKYLGDTTHLSTELHGAYLLLLMSMWKKDGVLPADDQQLQPITKLTPARYRNAKPILMSFFRPTADGLGLTQKRLTTELQRSKTSSVERSNSGKQGAEKRWQSHSKPDGKPDGKSDGKPVANGMANPMANGWQKVWQTGSNTQYSESPSEPPHNTENAHAFSASARGEVGKALKAAGVNMTSVNLDDPRLTALIEQGATPVEFEGLAREAIANGKTKPFAWVLAVLPERRAQAAATHLEAPPAPPPWFETAAGIKAKGAELGMPWREDGWINGTHMPFPTYSATVRTLANGHAEKGTP